MWLKPTCSTEPARAPHGRGGTARPLHIPKVREHAELTLTDGSRLVGYVFIEATSRIQDMLNASNPFFSFLDERDQVHLVNKSAVSRVQPHDG